MALEIAKRQNFYFSKNTDNVFYALWHNLSYYEAKDFFFQKEISLMKNRNLHQKNSQKHKCFIIFGKMKMKS